MKTTVKSPYRPLSDRILAKPIEAETKTKSGILLTEDSAEKAKPELANVIAVGPGVEEVKVDDQIVYAKYGPDKVKHDGVEYLLLHEEDCLAVVTQ